MSAVTNPVADTVEEIIANNKVVVFSLTYSDDCTAAKDLFIALDVDFYVMELDQQKDEVAIQQYLQDKTKKIAFPFIFIKQKYIGGFHELMAAYKNHQLEKWLE